jgi:hypothetical protein
MPYYPYIERAIVPIQIRRNTMTKWSTRGPTPLSTLPVVDNPRWLIDIPQCFAIDHDERDLPTGIEVKKTKRLITYRCTIEELQEWHSDAEFYSDCAGQGWCMDNAIGLQSSAKATVRRVEKLFEEIEREKHDI